MIPLVVPFVKYLSELIAKSSTEGQKQNFIWTSGRKHQYLMICPSADFDAVLLYL